MKSCRWVIGSPGGRVEGEAVAPWARAQGVTGGVQKLIDWGVGKRAAPAGPLGQAMAKPQPSRRRPGRVRCSFDGAMRPLLAPLAAASCIAPPPPHVVAPPALGSLRRPGARRWTSPYGREDLPAAVAAAACDALFRCCDESGRRPASVR